MIKQVILKRFKNLITTDPYYDVNMYNRFLTSLSNNNVNFNEYILYDTPYHWYIDIDKQIIIDCDEISLQNKYKLIRKVKPVVSSQEYACQRKSADRASLGITRLYGINDYMKEAIEKKFGWFLDIRNLSTVRDLSKKYGKIYWLGKYFDKYYIYFTTNKNIQLEFNKNNKSVIARMEDFNGDILKCETFINGYVFMLKDRLTKYYETPYVYNGTLYQTTKKMYDFIN